jgi:hypothetical protein
MVEGAVVRGSCLRGQVYVSRAIEKIIIAREAQ